MMRDQIKKAFQSVLLCSSRSVRRVIASDWLKRVAASWIRDCFPGVWAFIRKFPERRSLDGKQVKSNLCMALQQVERRCMDIVRFKVLRGVWTTRLHDALYTDARFCTSGIMDKVRQRFYDDCGFPAFYVDSRRKWIEKALADKKRKDDDDPGPSYSELYAPPMLVRIYIRTGASGWPGFGRMLKEKCAVPAGRLPKEWVDCA